MWHISIHTFVSQEFSSVSAFTTAMLLLFSGLHLFDQAISISRTGWILVKPWQTCKLVLLVSVSRALVILLLWCVCVCAGAQDVDRAVPGNSICPVHSI